LQGGRGREALATVPELAEHPGGEPTLQSGQTQQDLAVRVGCLARQQRLELVFPNRTLAAQEQELLSG
jgi:hypothetical protein